MRRRRPRGAAVAPRLLWIVGTCGAFTSTSTRPPEGASLRRSVRIATARGPSAASRATPSRLRLQRLRAAPDADDALDLFFAGLEPDVDAAADGDDSDDGGGGWSDGADYGDEWSSSAWDERPSGGPNFAPDGDDWLSLDVGDTEAALEILSRPRSSYEAEAEEAEEAEAEDEAPAVVDSASEAEEAAVATILRPEEAGGRDRFQNAAFEVGDAVEVLCEEDGYWYEATLSHVGLVVCVAYYEAYDESETVDLCRVRPPGSGADSADDAFDGLVEGFLATPDEATPDYGEVDSHTLVKRADDYEGYSYVDEQACVGCYNCAVIAPATFFMEENYGSARVFHQHGDADETIEEAIDTCPVNCIHTVSFHELERLEVERRNQKINFMGRLMARAQGTSIGGASMTMTSTGRASKPQRVAVTDEDADFKARAAEKDKARQDRARRDLEATTGVRTGTVDL